MVFSVLTRVLVWGMFFAAVYVFNDFLLLLFLTFVFSYILNAGVRRLEPYIRSRAWPGHPVRRVFPGHSDDGDPLSHSAGH